MDEDEPVDEESFVILNQEIVNDQEDNFENSTTSPTLRVPQELQVNNKGSPRQQQDRAVQNENIVQCPRNERFDKDNSFVLINENSCNESERSKFSIRVNEDCTVSTESKIIGDNAGNRQESGNCSKAFDEYKPLNLKGTHKVLSDQMDAFGGDQEIKGCGERREYDDETTTSFQLTEDGSVHDEKLFTDVATGPSKVETRSQNIDQPLPQNAPKNLEKHPPTDSERDQPNSSKTVVTSENFSHKGPIQENCDNKENISHDGVNVTRKTDTSQSTSISPVPEFKADLFPSRIKLFKDKGNTSTALPSQDENHILEIFSLPSNSESFCVINENSIGHQDLSSSTEVASNVDIRYDTMEMESNCANLPNDFSQPSYFMKAIVKNNVTEIMPENQFTDTQITSDMITIEQDGGFSMKEVTKEALGQTGAPCDIGEANRKNNSNTKQQKLGVGHFDHNNIAEVKETIEYENTPSKRNDSPRVNEEMGEITLKNESNSIQGRFGEMRLLKVGKFWLISLNGVKTKLPTTINTDRTLRFEIVKNLPVLLTDSLCYNINILENILSLEQNNYYLTQKFLPQTEVFQVAESSTDQEEQPQMNIFSPPIVEDPGTRSKVARVANTGAFDDGQAKGSQSIEVFYGNNSVDGAAPTNSIPSGEKSSEIKVKQIEKKETESIENPEQTPKIKGKYIVSKNADDSHPKVNTIDEASVEVKLQRVGGVICLSIDRQNFEIPNHIEHGEILSLENKGGKVFIFSKYELKIETGKVMILDESAELELMPLDMKSTDKGEKGETKSLKQSGLRAEVNENDKKDAVTKVEESEKLRENSNKLEKRITGSQCFENDSETVILDDTALSVRGSFGQIKLIKVGKFWLIAINGFKSKLPISINTDQTLRFEIENKEVLLLSDTVCYKVKANDNNILLEETNFYVQAKKVISEIIQEDTERTDGSQKIHQELKQEKSENVDKFEGKEEVKDSEMDELNKLMMQMSVEDTKLYNSSEEEGEHLGHNIHVEKGSHSGKNYELDVRNTFTENTPKHQRKVSTSRPSNPAIVTRRVGLPDHLPWKRLMQEFQIPENMKSNFGLLEASFLTDGNNTCMQMIGEIENVRDAENYLVHDIIEKIIKREIHLRFQVMDTFQKTTICRILEESLTERIFLYFENNRLFIVCFGNHDSDRVVNNICNSVTEKTVVLAGSWRKKDILKTVLDNLQRIEKGVYISIGENRANLVVTGLKSEVNDLVRQIEKLTNTGNFTMFQRDQSFTPKMKTHSLTPCDTWLQLAERFELSNILSCKDESVLVEFKKTQEKSETVCKCIIKGDNENDVESVYKKFRDNYVNQLRTIKVQLQIKHVRVLQKTKLYTLMNDRYPELLILPDKDDFVLLTFNENMDLQSVSRSIRRDFTDNKIQLQGSWKQLELAQKMVKEIGMKYDKINMNIDKTDLSLYIVGIKESVNAATNEIVQKMTDEDRVTKSMCLKDGYTFDMLVKDRPFLKEMERKYVVDIQLSPQGRCLKVHGKNYSVLCCEKEIQEYCSNLYTDKILVNMDQMDKIEPILTKDQNNVMIESRMHSLSINESSDYFKDDSKERKSFTFPNGQKLMIMANFSEDDGSNVIVKMNEGFNGLEGFTRHHDHGLIRIRLNIPVCSDDAVIRTKKFITKILTEVGEDNESVIVFKIPMMNSWSTDDISSCFLEAIYKHFVEKEKGTNPQFIILSPIQTEYEYFVGSCKIQMNKLLKEKEKCEAQNCLQISVVEGKLNEFKADVLVNTAAANLDLRQGAVSSALLSTAGPQMQDEVRRDFKHLLKPGEIVTSAGYKLECQHVLHGTLSIFDERRQNTLRGEYQSFLRNCLTKATEFKAKSIAFPAIGTGNLRYPVEFVTTEMFTTVKEFRQSTTLQHVYFVVFPGDRSAVQAFRKQGQEERRSKEVSATSVPDASNQSRTVEIRVTGQKDNVQKALHTIKSIQDERNSPDENNMKPMSYADAIKLPPSKPVTESLPSAVRQAFACETAEGLCVRVYASDMLHLPVDGIINLTDSNLDNSSGLASLIADSAGDDLKRDCRGHIRDYGHMRIGEVMKSCAGNLKYRCIIHVVWPQWIDYTPHTEANVLAYRNDLKKTIIAGLNLAEHEILSTVAIPAASFDNQNAPTELGVMQFVLAIKEFSGSKWQLIRRLKEIHVVDVDGKNVALFEQGFAEMLINNQPCPWNWRVYAKQQNGSKVKSQQSEQSSGRDAFNSFPYFMETEDGLSCKITHSRIVNISYGDLLRFKRSDAIVCSEDTSGSAAGGVAKMLLQHGGWTYQHEKRSQYQMIKFKTGDIFITSGGVSGFRQIIHAIMPHRMHFPKQGEKEWENALGETMNKIFETVEERKYKSVVMSLLGTGAGSSDPKQCARILLDSFMYSCTKYPDSILFLDVVNYDINRHKVVAGVFKDGVIQLRACTSESMWISEPKVGRGLHSKVNAVRPKSNPVCGVMVGDQPDGTMIIDFTTLQLPTYSCRTIKITYRFNRGKQRKRHPTPGKSYTGTERVAYLPDLKAGHEVCTLLKLAFERRLVFTVGTSRTNGVEGITWNDISHKTFTKPNAEFGYPDQGYFDRVKRELANKGITQSDPDFDRRFLDTLNRGDMSIFPVIINVPKIGMTVSSV